MKHPRQYCALVLAMIMCSTTVCEGYQGSSLPITKSDQKQKWGRMLAPGSSLTEKTPKVLEAHNSEKTSKQNEKKEGEQAPIPMREILARMGRAVSAPATEMETETETETATATAPAIAPEQENLQDELEAISKSLEQVRSELDTIEEEKKAAEEVERLALELEKLKEEHILSSQQVETSYRAVLQAIKERPSQTQRAEGPNVLDEQEESKTPAPEQDSAQETPQRLPHESEEVEEQPTQENLEAGRESVESDDQAVLKQQPTAENKETNRESLESHEPEEVEETALQTQDFPTEVRTRGMDGKYMYIPWTERFNEKKEGVNRVMPRRDYENLVLRMRSGPTMHPSSELEEADPRNLYDVPRSLLSGQRVNPQELYDIPRGLVETREDPLSAYLQTEEAAHGTEPSQQSVQGARKRSASASIMLSGKRESEELKRGRSQSAPPEVAPIYEDLDSAQDQYGAWSNPNRNRALPALPTGDDSELTSPGAFNKVTITAEGVDIKIEESLLKKAVGRGNKTKNAFLIVIFFIVLTVIFLGLSFGLDTSFGEKFVGLIIAAGVAGLITIIVGAIWSFVKVRRVRIRRSNLANLTKKVHEELVLSAETSQVQPVTQVQDQELVLSAETSQVQPVTQVQDQELVLSAETSQVQPVTRDTMEVSVTEARRIEKPEEGERVDSEEGERVDSEDTEIYEMWFNSIPDEAEQPPFQSQGEPFEGQGVEEEQPSPQPQGEPFEEQGVEEEQPSSQSQGESFGEQGGEGLYSRTYHEAYEKYKERRRAEEALREEQKRVIELLKAQKSESPSEVLPESSPENPSDSSLDSSSEGLPESPSDSPSEDTPGSSSEGSSEAAPGSSSEDTPGSSSDYEFLVPELSLKIPGEGEYGILGQYTAEGTLVAEEVLEQVIEGSHYDVPKEALKEHKRNKQRENYENIGRTTPAESYENVGVGVETLRSDYVNMPGGGLLSQEEGNYSEVDLTNFSEEENQGGGEDNYVDMKPAKLEARSELEIERLQKEVNQIEKEIKDIEKVLENGKESLTLSQETELEEALERDREELRQKRAELARRKAAAELRVKVPGLNQELPKRESFRRTEEGEDRRARRVRRTIKGSILQAVTTTGSIGKDKAKKKPVTNISRKKILTRAIIPLIVFVSGILILVIVSNLDIESNLKIVLDIIGTLAIISGGIAVGIIAIVGFNKRKKYSKAIKKEWDERRKEARGPFEIPMKEDKKTLFGEVELGSFVGEETDFDKRDDSSERDSESAGRSRSSSGESVLTTVGSEENQESREEEEGVGERGQSQQQQDKGLSVLESENSWMEMSNEEILEIKGLLLISLPSGEVAYKEITIAEAIANGHDYIIVKVKVPKAKDTFKDEPILMAHVTNFLDKRKKSESENTERSNGLRRERSLSAPTIDRGTTDFEPQERRLRSQSAPISIGNIFSDDQGLGRISSFIRFHTSITKFSDFLRIRNEKIIRRSA